MTAYARDVLAGRVLAGPFVRLACRRHLADVRQAKRRGLVWDVKKAQLAIAFFPDVLRLDNDRPFALLDWQAFIVGSLFGWLRADGTRRFRTAYVETGKGSGKTPLAAGIGLKGLGWDQTSAAEIYSAATDREQARICFLDAKHMVERSPDLREVVDPNVASLVYGRSASTFRPVSSEHRGLDGKRVHMAILDELHEHPSAIVADKMRAGTKKDPNALIFEITNSGYNRQSVCWQHREYSRQVLEGHEANDTWFAYVCALDEGDDWRDEAVWPKVNPSLPGLPGYEYLREQVQEATGMPAKENIVKRLNFCIWTEQADRWITMDLWDANGGVVEEAELLGRPCYAGLDLSTTTDLSALALVFPNDDGTYDVLPQFWAPAARILERSQRDGVKYDLWRDQGYLTATPGETIDYEFIRQAVLDASSRYNLQEVAYDPWNATQLRTQLEDDGITMVEMRQGFASLSAPTKELMTLLLGRRLRHGNHPVLRWNAANVSVKQDPAGNLKPDKSVSTERIDGIVALIMAIARASLRSEPGWGFVGFSVERT